MIVVVVWVNKINKNKSLTKECVRKISLIKMYKKNRKNVKKRLNYYPQTRIFWFFFFFFFVSQKNVWNLHRQTMIVKQATKTFGEYSE